MTGWGAADEVTTPAGSGSCAQATSIEEAATRIRKLRIVRLFRQDGIRLDISNNARINLNKCLPTLHACSPIFAPSAPFASDPQSPHQRAYHIAGQRGTVRHGE